MAQIGNAWLTQTIHDSDRLNMFVRVLGRNNSRVNFASMAHTDRIQLIKQIAHSPHRLYMAQTDCTYMAQTVHSLERLCIHSSSDFIQSEY